LDALLAGFMNISGDKNLITRREMRHFLFGRFLSTPFPDISAASWPQILFLCGDTIYDKLNCCMTQSTALANFLSICVENF
jgi:hypothetical protein